MRAEIIAIGDELVTGVRLDTNSQWIAQQLDHLGIRIAFHSAVGDDLEEMQSVFQTAISRANLIITTGGLGPTADDLTRNAIAQVAGVDLTLNPTVLAHIQKMYHSRGRTMPPNNEVQAWFPTGSSIIENLEGTAPGIDFAGDVSGDTDASKYRIFSFPGVPAELKQMWRMSAETTIKQFASVEATTLHHTIHCFGAGESAIEMQLPDLIERGRDPLVGITASAATISLRIATRGADEVVCRKKIAPTAALIRERLGDLVYGENGQQLEDIVCEILNANSDAIAVFDWGLHGEVAKRIGKSDNKGTVLSASRAFGSLKSPTSFSFEEKLQFITTDKNWHENATLVLVIGPIDRNEKLIEQGDSHFEVGFAQLARSSGNAGDVDQSWKTHVCKFRFSGHSAWREERAVKDVLNAIRLLQ